MHNPYANAKCVGKNPQDWLVKPQHLGGKWTRVMETHRAQALCDGCPCIEQCAIDGLENSDVGVIRAGLPLSSNAQGNMSRPSRQNLQKIVAKLQAGKLVAA